MIPYRAPDPDLVAELERRKQIALRRFTGMTLWYPSRQALEVSYALEGTLATVGDDASYFTRLGGVWQQVRFGSP